MPEIEIRRIRDESDAEPCDALFREYALWLLDQMLTVNGLDLRDSGQAVHDDFRAEWPKLFGERGRMYLMLVDGEPAGVGALKPYSDKEAELKRVYVKPDYRGGGHARRLVEQVITDARDLNYTSVVLESLNFMADAQALYRSLGFLDIPRFDGTEGGAHGVEAFEVFMRLQL
ncbi:MAG: GNAT family N-acetyltransferase [Actinobacteria bacterium]|uniref:Unannotated protein n=1 Tax=freshwater metagenome TaxID=449393 RepID=A0A6J7ELQ9_9ZZZZ|nr:GNAT family N-acetyltransferase [Actinomycetota bacterium]